MKKLIRIKTVLMSLDKLIESQFAFMKNYFKEIAVSSGGGKLIKVRGKDEVATFALVMPLKTVPLKGLNVSHINYKIRS